LSCAKANNYSSACKQGHGARFQPNLIHIRVYISILYRLAYVEVQKNSKSPLTIKSIHVNNAKHQQKDSTYVKECGSNFSTPLGAKAK
jgi:hypothetical protein